MAQQVVMPKQGNSVESCIIVEWKVKVGDKIAVGDILCSAETDKSTIEVESTVEGVLLAQLYAEGDEVPVMQGIAMIGEAGENVELPTEQVQEETKPKAEDVVVETKAAPVAASVSAVQAVGASPRAKALAEKEGMLISSVQPSGPKGRIIERDVLAAKGQPLSPLARQKALDENLAAPQQGSGIGGRVLASDLVTSTSPVAAAPVDEITEIPVKGVRKVTARRMMESIHSTCQLSLHAWADARALKRLRADFKASNPELGLAGITINDLVLFAVSRTLQQFPAFNAHFLGDKIVRYAHVHLGVATDTTKGLLVPVLRNSDVLSLKQLSLGVKALVGTCKDGTIAPDDLTGSTFTVSNVGSFGIEAFTPVLNVPEVAILGVGTIALKPVEDEDGDVAFIEHIGLSLTMDHQAVDGADAARFLRSLMDNIAKIDLLLAL